MTKLLSVPDAQAYVRRQYSHVDDFYNYADAALWTKTTNSGTVGAAGAGGVLTLTPTTSTNDYCYVATTNSLFLFDIDSTMRFGVLAKFTQANTNKAMVAIGLCNSVGQNTIIDTTGLPVASFSGAMFYTGSGNTVWSVRSSVGTTKTDTATTITAGGAYQFLEVEYKAISLTRGLVSYFVDGAVVLDPNAGYAKPLLHTIDATSAADMQLFFGTKNGDGNAQALLVDVAAWTAVR